MRDEKVDLVFYIFSIVAGMLIGAVLWSFILSPIEYKRGQVDALSGENIEYEFVKTIEVNEWRKINE